MVSKLVPVPTVSIGYQHFGAGNELYTLGIAGNSATLHRCITLCYIALARLRRMLIPGLLRSPFMFVLWGVVLVRVVILVFCPFDTRAAG